MPKKTKKEKIIAQYRRKLKLLERLQAPPSFNKEVISNQNSKKATNKTELNITFEKKNEDKDIKTVSFFLADLRKSFILIGIIIALEILLYFVRIIN